LYDRAHPDGLERLKTELQALVSSCTTVQEQRIGYGNLRCEFSDWDRDEEQVTNIAVIYETPGGSTCQINVYYDHQTEEFSFLDEELEDTVVAEGPQEALQMVKEHVRSIPQRRLELLEQQMDAWINQGKTRSQLFGELNKLLQAEFLGGRISTTELKKGIEYALDRFSSMDRTLR